MTEEERKAMQIRLEEMTAEINSLQKKIDLKKKIREELLNTLWPSVQEFKFSQEPQRDSLIKTAFRLKNLYNISDVVELTEKEIASIHYIGSKTLADIKSSIAEVGLHLKDK